MKPTVEYVGFRTVGDSRRYHLRVRCNDVTHDYTVSIPNALFAPGLARFQDGPELAFQRLQRETSLDPQPGPGTFTVTTAEFEAFREVHRPPAKPRRAPAAPPGSPKIG
jgi:hypothetical protein